jgi:hypothetical protein
MPKLAAAGFRATVCSRATNAVGSPARLRQRPDLDDE